LEKSKEKKLSDKNFLMNNLTLERDALKNKLKVKLKKILILFIFQLERRR
jgi:hypothetical protein